MRTTAPSALSAINTVAVAITSEDGPEKNDNEMIQSCKSFSSKPFTCFFVCLVFFVYLISPQRIYSFNP